MVLDTNNFKQVGAAVNFANGGQVYSVFSDTDTLATMLADGYLDGLAKKLNMRDSVILSGVDGSQIVQVTNPNSLVTVSVSSNTGVAATLTGPGEVPITARSVDLTSIGIDTSTLADGAVGQLLHITFLGGSVAGVNVVPDNGLGYTSILLESVGDSVQLEMKSVGWALIGVNAFSGPIIG